jgi:tetratricopeptide (TPR) repeat protein
VCWLLPDARRLRSSGPAREKNKTTKTMVMLLALTVCSVLFSFRSFAQEQSLPEPRKELKAGNKSYQQKDYNAASKAYLQAVKKNPKSFSGNYNLGDALYQANQNEAARQAFQRSLPAAGNKLQQAEAFHNIGNTYLKEKKWDEAASAFKQALKLNSKDMDTKYNLAYAQAMIKKDQQNNKDNKKNKNNQDKQDQQNKDQQKQNKKEQEDKNKKDRPDKGQQNKDQQDNKQETAHPRPQASKLTKQQADNILNALSQEEKKLHEEKEKGKAVPMQQEKDW